MISKTQSAFNSLCLILVLIFFAFSPWIAFSQSGSWEKVEETTHKVNSVFFLDEDVGWAVGNNGSTYYTNDSGKTWESNYTNTDEDLFSVYFVSKTEGWAVGSNGLLLTTNNGGKDWSRHLISDENLQDIFFVNSKNGWIVSQYGGTIYTTKDGGKTWSKQFKNSEEYFKAVYFINEKEGWVVGSGGVFHTTNAGQSWQKQQIVGENFILNSIDFTNNNLGVIVGKNGIILKTKNGGDSWTEVPLNLGGANKYTLTDVQIMDSNTFWISGQERTTYYMTREDVEQKYGKRILYTANGGNTFSKWNRSSSPSPEGSVGAMHFVNKNLGFAVGNNMILRYSVE